MKQIFTMIFSIGIGALASFIYLTGTPDVCQKVVMRDIQDHNAYVAKLSAVMPVENVDYLTAMTRGK